ncbi:phenylacetic acid degradation protein [Melaminivora suipulveris]|uniref:Phenylacetic acid degradation protein n=1 Tax=Melaminivora suipulveris TaxID=2109913 RepID=A0A2R3QH06_9BURK|nr:PaaI family thioesterase [Melaminivora suipulveris]AVO51034.1 phenylacetic acid degradation protein [Melaminivora suipulveris]
MTHSQPAPPANPFANEPPSQLFGLPMPMAAALALRGERIGDDRAQVRMGFQPAFANSRHQAHGGAIAALLDCTLASAVRAHDPAGNGVATIDLTLHFVATASGDLIASAHCERRGRSISFARGEVRAEDGTLVALATGTFKLMPRQALGG